MLLEAGQPLKVVQEMLGHTSITVTGNIYSHVTPAFARQAADALARVLGAGRMTLSAETVFSVIIGGLISALVTLAVAE
jgi:site-specific recombinase XerD